MKRVHYIWIVWISETGSAKAHLWYNGNCSAKEAMEAINKSDAEALKEAAPKWMKRLKAVEMSAENILTDEVVYRKVF